jgi:hypothetical protein
MAERIARITIKNQIVITEYATYEETMPNVNFVSGAKVHFDSPFA